MALFELTDTFAYIDLNDRIVRVDGTDVVDKGPWNYFTAYQPNQVILYQNTLYICLASNTSQPPTSVRDDFWAALVKTEGGEVSLTLEYVYATAVSAGSLAYQAMQQAWYGTQAAVEISTSVAYPALTTAWDGTRLAYEALQEAWYGTNLTAQSVYPALVTAWAGTATADVALRVAGAGTDLAYAALQAAWYGTQAAASIGYPALVTSWVGTATANSALAAATAGTTTATLALEVASAGTNAANSALVAATAGTITATLALHVASAGTDLAFTALQTAWAGTSGVAAEAAARAAADSAEAAARMSADSAEAGTRASADASLQSQIDSLTVSGGVTSDVSYAALQTAWSGTAGVQQVQVTAVSGSNTANNALALAQTLNAIIGAGQSGTKVVHVSQVPLSNKADLQVTVANGVIISVLGSRFGWEDFESYDLGIVGQGTGDLGLSTSWAGTGVIYTADQHIGVYGSDALASTDYSIGTNTTGLFAGGRRWAGSGLVSSPYLQMVAAEPFVGYGTATGITGAQIAAGTGWSGAPTLYQY